jgi:aerobic-type carbon monoxide dehydrogenase small subunit (CoxS/CutS family)
MQLSVNGVRRNVETDPERTLLWVLRNELDLTGVKYGCGEGQCGACTVLVGGVARHSCQLPVGSVAGQEITTIEGLADGEHLHPVQQAFIDCDAMQCGYCTPGMIVTAAQLLNRNSAPSREDICHGLEGNLCRCTGYQHIIEAVQYAAQKAGQS